MQFSSFGKNSGHVNCVCSKIGKNEERSARSRCCCDLFASNGMRKSHDISQLITLLSPQRNACILAHGRLLTKKDQLLYMYQLERKNDWW
jgi:hypothetical protein